MPGVVVCRNRKQVKKVIHWFAIGPMEPGEAENVDRIRNARELPADPRQDFPAGLVIVAKDPNPVPAKFLCMLWCKFGRGAQHGHDAHARISVQMCQVKRRERVLAAFQDHHDIAAAIAHHVIKANWTMPRGTFR